MESSVIDRYYKLNRIILKIIGLWPYQNSKWIHVQAVIIISLYLSIIFGQLAVFVTHKCTVNLLADVLSLILTNILIIFYYDMFYFNSDFFKEIMEHILYDWKSFKDNSPELAIMSDHAAIVKMCTQVFSFAAFIGTIIFIMLIFMPKTLDIILPLNESRPLKIYITIEYFVDPYKYYCLLSFHLIVTACLGAITVLGTALLLLIFGYHACAMFKVANYRMGTVMDENILRMPSSKREHIIFKRIISVVNTHRRNIQFCKFQLLYLRERFTFMMVISVMDISICLFRFLEAIKMFNDVIEIIISIGMLFTLVLYSFFACHIGQQVIDNYADIVNVIYNLPWYVSSLKTQRLISFLLLNNIKDVHFPIFGSLEISYECLTTIAMTSVSYFTVIYSTR